MTRLIIIHFLLMPVYGLAYIQPPSVKSLLKDKRITAYDTNGNHKMDYLVKLGPKGELLNRFEDRNHDSWIDHETSYQNIRKKIRG